MKQPHNKNFKIFLQNFKLKMTVKTIKEEFYNLFFYKMIIGIILTISKKYFPKQKQIYIIKNTMKKKNLKTFKIQIQVTNKIKIVCKYN